MLQDNSENNIISYIPISAFDLDKVSLREEIISNNIIKMNLTSNTAFLTLAIGALGGVVAALQAHDFYLAIGLFVFGVAMVVIYEKTPPTTPTV